ncbi:MAG: Uma2 family endonuclease, partial [Microcoleus sp. CSU_2_2]|nr:Uma2 family endonuclease [Microcoleus sp. CSU_2_2]
TRYIRLEANDRGHYPIDLMGVELGVWSGSYQNQAQQWLRWWDSEGNLLLTGSERARLESLRVEQERQRADAESQRADREREQKERLAAYLRSQGIDPDLI